jgi:Family of unknown function (DUF5752)
MNEGFHFYTQSHLVELLKMRAKNLIQLHKGIKQVPIASIYFHTHRFLLQHGYLSPEPPNDFAYWITTIMNLKVLGEAFMSIDIIDYTNLENLRKKFLELLEQYFTEKKDNGNCPEGHEFHFMTCRTFVMPTPYVAYDLPQFAQILGKITIRSLYFHVFEARIRLQSDDNDFSLWIREHGYPELANKIIRLDPYNITLEKLRTRLIEMVKRYV